MVFSEAVAIILQVFREFVHMYQCVFVFTHTHKYTHTHTHTLIAIQVCKHKCSVIYVCVLTQGDLADKYAALSAP